MPILKIYNVILLLSVATFLFAEEPHHTTAFLQAPRSTSALITYSPYSTDQFWNKNGKKLPTYNHFKAQNYLLYAEYGVNRSNSVFLHGGYCLDQEKMNGNSYAFSDIEFGLKRAFYENDNSAISLEIIAVVPMKGVKSSVRYGKAAMQTSLLFSQRLLNNGYLLWVDSGVGYRVYQGFPSNQIRSFIALGLAPAQVFSLIATGELICSFFNGKEKKNYNNIAFNPNYRLAKGKIEWRIAFGDRATLSIGIYRHFWGENVGAGGGLFCGSWFYF